MSRYSVHAATGNGHASGLVRSPKPRACVRLIERWLKSNQNPFLTERREHVSRRGRSRRCSQGAGWQTPLTPGDPSGTRADTVRHLVEFYHKSVWPNSGLPQHLCVRCKGICGRPDQRALERVDRTSIAATQGGGWSIGEEVQGVAREDANGVSDSATVAVRQPHPRR